MGPKSYARAQRQRHVGTLPLGIPTGGRTRWRPSRTSVVYGYRRCALASTAPAARNAGTRGSMTAQVVPLAAAFGLCDAETKSPVLFPGWAFYSKMAWR